MFTHLHVHTEFSMLDGLNRIEPLIQRTKELRMGSLAITDHGGMYGAIDFYRLAKAAGINPIIGCEMYVAPTSRLVKNREDKSPYHMTVLSMNERGYQNLVKLVTLSNLEGFYYKPRIDRELLEQYHEGLIVLSGCPSGEVPGMIAQGNMDGARASASWYKELLGDRYFLELMEHGGVDELPTINKGLMELHRELDLPVVATNDSHYTYKEDAPLQDILICIHTNTNIQDSTRLRMTEDSYYLKSSDEMESLYKDLPEAITNTERIAEMCNLEMDFSQLRLPVYPIPEGMDAHEYLEKICWEGLHRRIGNVTDVEKERLEYELYVIKTTQFSNYFLVVWDIAKFVAERDIFFAVRGSAAASLVLYCLGVTNINPLPYTLVFERFLNVERKEMPDIDMDFQDDRREEVINYVVDKYGRDHVAQIITFGTLGARASIRDVGRALAMPYSDVDRIARLVPLKLHITLEEAKELNPEFKEACDADESSRKLIDIAQRMEGLTRHSSTHAAGVVISEEPLDDVVPLQRPIRGDEHGVAMTQYAMEPCAALGLLKMDFLGLVNLTILAKTRDLIQQTRGVKIDLQEIPLDDEETFALLARGETIGVFQMEGSGMTRYIKDLKPTSLSDVAAMIALYRPGPMEHISTFIDGKYGRIQPNYPHPALKDILEETYGVIVYQDQVLHIARTFAGYTLGEADIFRKAMGKKIASIMAQESERFVNGALALGYTKELAEQVFALVEPFAGYAFNKAHSVSYAIISYWTAYLKAHYTAEYMVSLLNAYQDNTEKVGTAISECRRLRIPVLPPDINKGMADYSIEMDDEGNKTIRFGMAAVKNVGAGAIESLLVTREKEGQFTSLEHMCKIADMSGINRKTLESLIKAGAFDTFGERAGLLEVIDRILALAHSEANLRDSNQTSMFDVFGSDDAPTLASIEIPNKRASDSEVNAWEVELLGVAVSSTNPLLQLVDSVDSDTIVYVSQIGSDMAGKKITLAGQVSSVMQRFTRNDKPFTIAGVSLMDGSVDVFIWEDKMAETDGLWSEGKLVTVTGSVRVRDDQISISCTEASEFSLPDSTERRKVVEQDMDVIMEESAPEVIEDTEATNGTDHAQQNGASQPGVNNNNSATNGNGNGHLAAEVSATPHRRVNLRINETGSKEDQFMLEDVKRLLLEYQGDDEVNLEIATQGHIITLEWPMVRVNACAELEQQLQDLLGSSGQVSIQGVMF